MLPVLMQSVLLASGGMVSVGSITIVILLLISDQGWRTGVAYAVGYVSAYTLIGTMVVWLGYQASGGDHGRWPQISSIMFTVLGILLLWLAYRNWQKPAVTDAQPPRLLTLLAGMTPVRALFFGAAVTVFNFKNLAIFLSAISVLLLSELALAAKLLIVGLDVLVFCASVIVPVLIYFVVPQRADAWLHWIKEMLTQYSQPIGIWVPLIFGLIFVINGGRGLLS